MLWVISSLLLATIAGNVGGTLIWNTRIPEELQPYTTDFYLKGSFLVQDNKQIDAAIKEGRKFTAVKHTYHKENRVMLVLFELEMEPSSNRQRRPTLSVGHESRPFIPLRQNIDAQEIETGEDPLLQFSGNDVALEEGIRKFRERNLSFSQASEDPTSSNGDFDPEVFEKFVCCYYSKHIVSLDSKEKVYYTLRKVDSVAYSRAGRAIQAVLSKMEKDKKNCKPSVFDNVQFMSKENWQSIQVRNTLIASLDKKVNDSKVLPEGEWELCFCGSDAETDQYITVYQLKQQGETVSAEFISCALVLKAKGYKIFTSEVVSSGASTYAEAIAEINFNTVKHQFQDKGSMFYSQAGAKYNVEEYFNEKAGEDTTGNRFIFVKCAQHYSAEEITKDEPSSKANTSFIYHQVDYKREEILTSEYALAVLECLQSETIVRSIATFQYFSDALTTAEEYASKFLFWYSVDDKKDNYNGRVKERIDSAIKSALEKNSSALELLSEESEKGKSPRSKQSVTWNLLHYTNFAPKMRKEGSENLRVFVFELFENEVHKAYCSVVKGSKNGELRGNSWNANSAPITIGGRSSSSSAENINPSSSSGISKTETTTGSEGSTPKSQMKPSPSFLTRSIEILAQRRVIETPDNVVVSSFDESQPNILNCTKNFFEDAYYHEKQNSTNAY